MLCCGGEKESTRDLKSAQNTPSRQMLPYSQQHPSQSSMSQHQQPLGPPPLSQQQGTRLGPTGMMGRGPNAGGMGQQHGIHHNQNMMNSFDHPGAHKDEFRKVDNDKKILEIRFRFFVIFFAKYLRIFQILIFLSFNLADWNFRGGVSSN